MNLPFWLTLALREGRSSIRRIGVYMGSITLGVAALVALHSFRQDVTRSVEQESRSILGADLRLTTPRPYSDSVLHVVDSLRGVGAEVSRVTDLVSMGFVERTQATRLVQVRAVDGGFPFFGEVSSEPAGEWARLGHDESVLVDEAVLVQLDAHIGDTITLGRARFLIAGTVDGLPTDLGFQSAIGPRVYLEASAVERTGLLSSQSLSRHLVFLRLPVTGDVGAEADAIDDRYRELFRNNSVSSTTAREQAEDLTDATRILTRFLGLIGLAALLLGGIGVASAIHVYVKDKLTSVAVLRCLGARQRTVFSAYLAQAAMLGLGGAALGVALGLFVQRSLPAFVSDLLPVEVRSTVDPVVVLVGLGIGVWVAVIFALAPLLEVRNVTPLQALRRDYEPEERKGVRARWLAYGALLLSVAGLSVWQAPTPGLGLAFAGALAVTLLLLWGAATGLVAATRRFIPRGVSYPVRQGVSNLFRPHNQTVAITLALGFGVFVIGSVYLVQGSLEQMLTLDEGAARANLLLFDIQRDQRSGVEELLGSRSEGPVEITPIVTARIGGVNGTPTAELMADSTDEGPARWTLRRTYRNTYREELGRAEQLVEGAWWPDLPPREEGTADEARISIEQDLANDLHVQVGDRITWDVQGQPVESRIVSIRTVDWARFETNFYVIFEPGALEDAPQTMLAMARVSDPTVRSEVQRDLVRGYPNVSVLDLARIQEALDRILRKVSGAIRFLALFAVLGGLVVLVGALATSRYQRMREGALLKTLGARRGQILRILVVEYLALGTLAALTGLVLSTAAAWGMVRFVFEGDFKFPLVPLLLLWTAIVAVTAGVGMASSRGVLARTPLTVLREIAE